MPDDRRRKRIAGKIKGRERERELQKKRMREWEREGIAKKKSERMGKRKNG